MSFAAVVVVSDATGERRVIDKCFQQLRFAVGEASESSLAKVGF